MTGEREGLAAEIAEVLLRHQRIPLYNSGPGRNCCVGCDNLYGETDGSNSPRHVAHLADALADLLAARDRRVRAEALREAASDPALRLSGHSGISIKGLRDRADRLEADA